jgi:hypothetical protein
MARLHLFADEAGCFNFSKHRSASKYFIVCTIVMPECDIGTKLIELRRNLAWNKAPLGDYFHATTDQQVIRNAVYEVISDADFSVQATVMEKSKAQPHIQQTEARFYQYGWFYHFRNSVRRYLGANDELMVTVATLGTKAKRIAFEDAVRDVLNQIVSRKHWIAAFWPCQSDPCLWVADYCTWAIQRKWELDDDRSYELIRTKINYEYNLWHHGSKHYY